MSIHFTVNKYVSDFCGPFRNAAESPPQFGDRQGYQMDLRNSDEALREAAEDLNEGADIFITYWAFEVAAGL